MAAQPPLLDRMVARIRSGGPLGFHEYMEAALYEPGGYYSRTAPGPGADYLTSPGLGPWFGNLVCRALERMWIALGSPGIFEVVEPGPGDGALAADVLSVAGGAFREALAWRFVETQPAVEKIQRSALRRRLGDARARTSWHRTMRAGDAAGCVLANEVLDNFPVRLFEATESGVDEVLVAEENGHLVEGRGAAPAVLGGVLTGIRSHLEPGDRFEFRPGIGEWCAAAGAALEAGYLLVIDYGDVQPDIWVRRPGGTLATYRDGALGVDPLENPGTADITAHVDFTALERSAMAAGFTDPVLVTQRHFLLGLGAREVLAGLRKERRGASGVDVLSLLGAEGRLGALLDAGGLGGLRVFIAARNAPPPASALGL